jgi:hypothetical protein
MKEKTAIRTAIHTLDLVAHVYNVLATYRFFFVFFFESTRVLAFWCTDLILLLSFPLIGCTLDVKNAPQFRFPIEFAYYAFRSVDSILYSRGVCVCAPAVSDSTRVDCAIKLSIHFCLVVHFIFTVG